MIKNTFIHIPGIGKKSEKNLWQKGILTWDDFFARERDSHFPQAKIDRIKKQLEESMTRLSAGDARYFSERLPSQEQWRLFGEFRNTCAYLDIETTGLGNPGDYITCIALYENSNVRHYVHGQNMEALADELLNHKILITYNGKCFDVPFISREFRMPVSHAQIDLRYVLKSLGYKGGLKGCEHQLGIGRHELEGVDGYFAVLLWNDYQNNGNKKALETLLAYNIEDTVNLEKLMHIAYNKKLAETPFWSNKITEELPEVDRKFYADIETITRIKEKYYGIGF